MLFELFECERQTTGGEDRRRPGQRRERENPEGEKAQESYAPGVQPKPLDREADSRAEKNPEGGQNAKRGAALGTAYGHVRGKRLWRVTPGADPA
jgi:hypothetical protein